MTVRYACSVPVQTPLDQNCLTLVSGLQGMQEQAEMLRDKLADAVGDYRRAQEDAAKELAAARIAWEIKRRDELQVCTFSTCSV